MKQRTIKKEVSLSGVGLHTGKNVVVKLLPAPPNHGYRFQRVDLPEMPIINADVNRVVSTNRGTVLKSGNGEIHTVEHLLSALSGMQIDNVLIQLDGPEAPILDGSATPYVKAIKEAEPVSQEEEREYFEIRDVITYKDPETGAEIIGMPSDRLEIVTMIDFHSKVLGQQFAVLDDLSRYEEEIAPCRTFVFLHELEYLFKQGLIQGGNLDNALVIAENPVTQEEIQELARKLNKPAVNIVKEGILNAGSLHFDNEPARHKLLDVLGDISLLGVPIIGKIIAKKPGHKANVNFTALLKQKYLDQKKLKGKPSYDPDQIPLFNSVQIESWLPHRYPFLLVDKITELTDTLVVGIKNVTFNEPFFQGHFPGNPVLPAVLQIEALAQTGGILALSTVEDPGNWDTYFIKIENARFKHKVVPGDTLILKMELLAPIRRGLCQMYGTAYVGNKIVSEGELTAQIVKRTEK